MKHRKSRENAAVIASVLLALLLFLILLAVLKWNLFLCMILAAAAYAALSLILREHPEKIPGARRYIDYYQETAANVLEHYTELRRTGLDTPETEKLLKQSEESIRTLRSAFQMQFEKLLQNEMMDMEADLNLLKKTLYAEGYSEPTEK